MSKPKKFKFEIKSYKEGFRYHDEHDRREYKSQFGYTDFSSLVGSKTTKDVIDYIVARLDAATPTIIRRRGEDVYFTSHYEGIIFIKLWFNKHKISISTISSDGKANVVETFYGPSANQGHNGGNRILPCHCRVTRGGWYAYDGIANLGDKFYTISNQEVIKMFEKKANKELNEYIDFVIYFISNLIS